MTIEEPASPHLRQLFAWWQAAWQAAGDRVPQRSTLDPLSLGPAVLPWLIFIELHPGLPGGNRFRFRYRLIGTGIVELFGFDPTGRHIDEIGDTPDIRATVARLNAAVDSGGPNVSRSPFMVPSREFIQVERLILPFAGGDGSIGFLLTGLAPLPA